MSGGADEVRPRLPYRGDAELAQDEAGHRAASAIRQRRAGGRLLNLDRMLLHSPPFAEGWNALLGAVRNRLTLSARLRELAICAIARLNDAHYEWEQHVGEWQAAGADEAQVAALAGAIGWWQDHPAFDAGERQVLALCLAMTREVAVPAPLVGALEATLGRQACVELVGTVAAYNMVSRFLVALGVSTQGEGGDPVP